MVIPVCLCTLILGIVISINEPGETKSYVLSPEELARWRSIKPRMERHEVTAILGQPDGPPAYTTLAYDPVVEYTWGGGKVYFRRNGGHVVEVIIPEYI